MNYKGAPGLEFGDGNIVLDPNVLNALPRHCRVVSTAGHGISFWASAGRINIELQDGNLMPFFIKVMSGCIGKNMLIGEFESMKAIHKQMPDFMPKLIACDSYESILDTHFILMEYKEMILDVPDPEKFTARLALLHQKSTSPNGMFGFHVTTHAGNLPQYTGWETTWETFFAKSMKQALDLEIKAKGYDSEFDLLIPALFDKVISRLLRPLETGGRSVKPSLVHGDLWFGNAGIDSMSGQPLVFDACCFFAHNEYEFGQWRPVCNRFGAEYLLAYQKCVPISPPEEDFDGRVDLYKLRFNTHVSALFYDNPTLRQHMLGDLRDLKERYG